MVFVHYNEILYCVLNLQVWTLTPADPSVRFLRSNTAPNVYLLLLLLNKILLFCNMESRDKTQS